MGSHFKSGLGKPPPPPLWTIPDFCRGELNEAFPNLPPFFGFVQTFAKRGARSVDNKRRKNYPLVSPKQDSI